MDTLTTLKSTAFRNHSNADFAPYILIVRLYLKNMRKFIWLLKSHMYVECVTQGSQEAVMSTGISLQLPVTIAELCSTCHSEECCFTYEELSVMFKSAKLDTSLGGLKEKYIQLLGHGY